jgi:DNA-directed RNA polymerase subunit F
VINMSGRKVNERTVSIPEVKKIMEKVKAEIEQIDPEEGLSHFQEITYNYVNKYAKMSEKDAKKIIKFLIEKYEIEEVYAINIVNLDPKSIFELRTILEKSFTGKILNDEQLRNLLSEIEELKS